MIGDVDNDEERKITMLIKAFNEGDRGVYKCVAANPKGRTEATVDMLIKGKFFSIS